MKLRNITTACIIAIALVSALGASALAAAIPSHGDEMAVTRATGTAEWGRSMNADIPGNGGYVRMIDDTHRRLKQTNDTQCSFYTASRTSWTEMTIQMMNSDEVSRSGYAGMVTGSVTNASTTAIKNYYCYPEITSNFFQAGTDSISFYMSPDKLTTSP